MNTRTVFIVTGALGALGVGATAAVGAGPFAPAEVEPEVEQVRTVSDRTSAVQGVSRITPTTLSAGSAVSAQTVASAQSPLSPDSAPSPD